MNGLVPQDSNTFGANDADTDYFQVENQLFSVSHSLLERHVPSSWSVLTQGSFPYRMPSSSGNPTFLPNVTVLEFGAFLKVIQGFWKEDEGGEFYMEWEEWQALLALAHRWKIQHVHDIAVLHLYDDFPPEEAEALLVQAQKYGVPLERWVEPMCVLMLGGYEPLVPGAGGVWGCYTVARSKYMYQLARRAVFVPEEEKRMFAERAAREALGLD